MKSKLLTHLVIILIGIILSVAYLSPVFQGQVLQQGDVVQAGAMQHEVLANKEKTGYYSLWTNNLFSGMPTFLMGVDYNNPVIGHLLVPIETIFKSPTSFIIYYFIGFYVLMVVMGFTPWMALLGAIMFTFSSYNFVILEAGHNTKARCIGFMPFIIAGTMLLFQKKYWLGAMLISLFLFFQIKSNHPQITYYMLLLLGCYFVYQLVMAIMKKEWKTFSLATGTFAIAASLAILANFTQLWVVYEYTKDTMRGGSELAVTPVAGQSKKEMGNAGQNIKGLDIDYAFTWSYGKMETATLLIPNAFGGASGGTLDEKSAVYKTLVDQNVPENQAMGFTEQIRTYWGPKPFTSGPVYLGAIVCFLFLLGIFIIKDHWRWWIFSISILALLLAWGKNLMWFNATFFELVPMYNKFRTVEMALVLLQVTFPLFAMLTLKKVLDHDLAKEELLKKLKYACIGMGGLLLVFIALPSLFLSFHGESDEEMKKQLLTNGAGFADSIMKALMADRESMARMDAIRSLLFIAVAAGAIWAFITGKLKQNIVLAIIGLAVLFDLWSVDKRYLNDGKFHEAEENNSSYETSAADNQILQDKSLSYRVFNYSSDPFNEAITSYHHKNIGGYNPAKLARYQDIIDSCLRKNNRNVINMLNTKYFIGKAQNGQEMAQMNPEAMGNAWLVDTVRFVQSPREEIMALEKFNPRTTAIIDASLFKDATSKQIFEKDSTAKIALLKNELDYLEYSFVAAKPQLAVLSEVFYADKKGKGWQAYIDGKAVEHFRVNYILRGLEVPAGTHKIEFKFEPQPFLRGQKISMFGSYAILLLFLVGFFMLYREFKANEASKPIDAVDPPKAKNKHAKS